METCISLLSDCFVGSSINIDTYIDCLTLLIRAEILEQVICGFGSGGAFNCFVAYDGAI